MKGVGKLRGYSNKEINAVKRNKRGIREMGENEEMVVL